MTTPGEAWKRAEQEADASHGGCPGRGGRAAARRSDHRGLVWPSARSGSAAWSTSVVDVLALRIVRPVTWVTDATCSSSGARNAARPWGFRSPRPPRSIRDERFVSRCHPSHRSRSRSGRPARPRPLGRLGSRPKPSRPNHCAAACHSSYPCWTSFGSSCSASSSLRIPQRLDARATSDREGDEDHRCKASHVGTGSERGCGPGDGAPLHVHLAVGQELRRIVRVALGSTITRTGSLGPSTGRGER